VLIDNTYRSSSRTEQIRLAHSMHMPVLYERLLRLCLSWCFAFCVEMSKCKRNETETTTQEQKNAQTATVFFVCFLFFLHTHTTYTTHPFTLLLLLLLVVVIIIPQYLSYCLAHLQDELLKRHQPTKDYARRGSRYFV
jgi:hypothetical protein